MREGWRILANAARGSAAPISASSRPGEEWLSRCLARNGDTDYGRRYDFGNMRNADEYRDRTPICGYEDIAPSVAAMMPGKPDILFSGRPAAFERTGGSAGGEKIVPYSRDSLLDFRRALLPWLGFLIATCGLGGGSAYMAISPALRRPAATPSGIPLGLPDGAYLGKDVLRAFSNLSAVPGSVAAIPEFAAWQLSTLYWLLRSDDLELISIWSPTFMLQLLEGLEQRFSELQSLLTKGGILNGEELPPDPQAAKRLESYDGQDASPLWPKLKVLSCWTDASSAAYAELLAERMPRALLQGKGLLLTEGAVTVPDSRGNPVPTLNSGFWEFLDEKGESHLSRELEKGRTYEVLMTTSGGLYRYRCGDTIRCDGHSGRLPILRFAGRNGVFSDLVGEKLTDAFVADCMRLSRCSGMLVPFPAPQAGYLLLTESQVETEAELPIEKLHRLEAALCRNPQYAYARSIDQLRAIARRSLPGLSARYTEFAVSRGRRLGDVKIPALCTDPEWRKEIER